MLKKILEIDKIPLSETEKNVVGLATNKVLVKTKLPIYSSPELASIIGHSIGDGHVSNERFKYVNQRKELVERVKQNVSLIFGCVGSEFFVEEKVCYGIQYPAVIGKLLGMLGAPLGRKVTKNFSVPEWIINSSDKIKCEFVKALFDGEGSVVWGKRQRFLSISMYKQNNLIESHKIFLNQVRELLICFEVKPSKICFKKNYKDTKEFGFRIYSNESLKNYFKHIGFSHRLKQEKLKYLIGIKSI